MKTRLSEYKEITQDYINYLYQQGHQELEDKQGEEKKKALEASPAPLSWARHFLTNVFYHGKHARFFLLDIVAGSIKKDFLWIFKKSDYADFIALVDRIANLERKPVEFLIQIRDSVDSETELLDYLFNGFISLQTNTPEEDKNLDYYSKMRALKRDIHDLAREHKVSKRIVKNIPHAGSHYKYELRDSVDNEEEKNKTRQIKSFMKGVVKVGACCMGIAEICIALTGFALCVFLPHVLTLKIIVGFSGFFFGYIFAKDDLFTLAKEIFLWRIFKKKNLNTGIYESLKGWQIAFILIFGFPLAVIAGSCIAGLAISSTTPVFTALLAYGLGAFVFCFTGSTFFLAVKKVISSITEENMQEYWNSLILKENQNQSKCWYVVCQALRFILELLKWTIALGVMSTVVVAGYCLFKDKCIVAFGKAYTGFSEFVSGGYSTIKMVFGTVKMLHLLQFFASKMLDLFCFVISKIGQTLYAIKRSFSSDGDPPPEQARLSIPLNPIQERARFTQSSYAVGGLALLVLRSGSAGGLYHDAAEKHQLPCPVGIGITSGSYVYAIYTEPFLKNNDKHAVEPLRKMSQS